MQEEPKKSLLFRQYIKGASYFWHGRSGCIAWSLFILLIVLIIVQLYVQYRINFWNRDFFNALSARDVQKVWAEGWLFAPLAISSVVIAVLTVWAKMTAQRKWRKSLSTKMIDEWVKDGKYRQLIEIKTSPRNAEYRIAEDARVATDLPFELSLGLIQSILTAITFISVLWAVGGTLHFSIGGKYFQIPGYLVHAALIYSALLTTATIFFARCLTVEVESKNGNEAEFRSSASRLRTHGEEHNEVEIKEDIKEVRTALNRVIESWRRLCWQLMRTTSVSTGNAILAPVIGLLLCTPKYLSDGMSIGQVVQAAAAFVTVQNSFNWLLNNYPSIADWLSSSNRVGYLLYALEELNEKDKT